MASIISKGDSNKESDQEDKYYPAQTVIHGAGLTRMQENLVDLHIGSTEPFMFFTVLNFSNKRTIFFYQFVFL